MHRSDYRYSAYIDIFQRRFKIKLINPYMGAAILKPFFVRILRRSLIENHKLLNQTEADFSLNLSKKIQQGSGIDTIKYHTLPRKSNGKVTKSQETSQTRAKGSAILPIYA